jgi:flagellar biosynthesis anti-sigma factor FlgM
MKIGKNSISSTSYTSATSAYGKVQQGKAPAQPVGDSVEVSSTGSFFQTAVEVAANTPDIRAEAIDGIQQEFAEGTYHRNEEEVADKVIQDYLSVP